MRTQEASILSNISKLYIVMNKENYIFDIHNSSFVSKKDALSSGAACLGTSKTSSYTTATFTPRNFRFPCNLILPKSTNGNEMNWYRHAAYRTSLYVFFFFFGPRGAEEYLKHFCPFSISHRRYNAGHII